jgi:transcriptional regulator with XRE-family HTH domain
MVRVKRPFEYDVSHEGRPAVTIRIPDLDVIACTNPDCHPDDPEETILHDDDATARITEETYRQLGLLTPAEIRRGRERLGLTQQELQDLLGLGGNSLSRWENGRIYQARSLDRLLRVAFGFPAVLGLLRDIQNGPQSRQGVERSADDLQKMFADLDITSTEQMRDVARRTRAPDELWGVSPNHDSALVMT